MSDASQSFDELLAAYYRAWLRFYPDHALALGDARFAECLRPSEDSDCGALKSLDANFIDGLESLDLEALDPDRRLDAQVAYGATLLEMEFLVEQNWRKRDPAAYLPTIGLFQLLLRKPDNLESLLRARLKKVPGYLQSAALRLQSSGDSVAPFWLQQAVDEARTGAGYLNQLADHPTVAAFSDESLGVAIAEASGAMMEYARFLDEQLRPMATGSAAVGTRYFNNVIRFRHGLNIDIEAIEGLGERLAHEAREELQTIYAKWGVEDISGALGKLEEMRPSSDALKELADQLDVSRAFFQDSGLFGIPEQFNLEITETPEFLHRRVPLLAYLRPLPNDPRQQAWLLVTLAELPRNDFELGHLAIHEGVGRHLQCVSANLSKAANTYPRLLNSSASIYEGWAAYVERLAEEAGYWTGEEHRFLMFRNQLWHALRIILDVGIHTQNVSPENAIDLLVRQLGISKARASAEVSWYSRYPGAPMGYALGCQVIEALRGLLREQERDFDIRKFHDTLLTSGSVGIGYLIPRHWGEAIWQQVKETVFKL